MATASPGQLERSDAEKVEHVPQSLGSPRGEILHGQDEQLFARKVREPALELIGVEAAREVGVVAVVIVLAPLACADAEPGCSRLELDLRLGCQAVGLGLERILEGQLFAPVSGASSGNARRGALDGIAEDRDEPDVRDCGRHTLRYERVEHVVRRRLAGDGVTAALAGQQSLERRREERAVPSRAEQEALVEEVDLLVRPRDLAASAGGAVDIGVE